MKGRMLRGELHLADDPELAAEHVTRGRPAGVVSVGVPATVVRSVRAYRGQSERCERAYHTL